MAVYRTLLPPKPDWQPSCTLFILKMYQKNTSLCFKTVKIYILKLTTEDNKIGYFPLVQNSCRIMGSILSITVRSSGHLTTGEWKNEYEFNNCLHLVQLIFGSRNLRNITKYICFTWKVFRTPKISSKKILQLIQSRLIWNAVNARISIQLICITKLQQIPNDIRSKPENHSLIT